MNHAAMRQREFPHYNVGFKRFSTRFRHAGRVEFHPAKRYNARLRFPTDTRLQDSTMPSEPMGNVHLPYLRRLPAVDELLRTPQAQLWQARVPRHLVTNAVRQALQATRRCILQTAEETALAALPVGAAAILAQVEAILRAAQGRELQPLINATGGHRTHQPGALAAGRRRGGQLADRGRRLQQS